MAAERMVPIGLAKPLPAISGAEPWMLKGERGQLAVSLFVAGVEDERGDVRFVETHDDGVGVRSTCQTGRRQ
jgi:hypothetical protein